MPDDDPRPGEPATLSLSGEAAEFFRDDVLGRAINKPISDEAWRLLELDPVYKQETSDVEHARLSDVPEVDLACDAYRNLAPAPEFDASDEFVKRLAYYVIVAGAPGGEQAFFFRSFTASAELRRKTGAAIFRRDGQFDRVEERIFLFDESIDCFVFDGELFVIRKGDYRRIFQQFAALQAKAREAAKALDGRVPIANFDAFADACARQAAMADKLIAVQGRSYFSTLTLEKLEPVIAEFGLDIGVETIDGVRKLVFKTDPAHRWLIVKLLDDDYLRSTLTDLHYEANSKLRHSAREAN
ncbi:MAG TPA: Kiwa anti-phage protein KwaB-like domain-containing protein [Baekduia sp.]